MTNDEGAAGPFHVVRTLAMALWLPAVFLCGIVFLYLPAFHAPAPHGVDVAVAAPPGATGRLQQQLDAASPGGFTLKPAFDGHEARSAVLGREAVAGYVPDARHPVLYVAKAAGAPLEPVLRKAFTAASRTTGATLDVRETVPTVPGDGLGTSMFYLVLACTLPPYFVVVAMQRAVGFGRWAHVATIVGAGAVIAAVGYVGAAHVVDAIPRHPLAMLYLFLLTQAVSLTTYGLAHFFGHFFPAVAVTVFVLLSMPASGAAVPIELVPRFFQALHPALPLGGAVDAIRDVGYFGGHRLGPPTAVLCAWIALGAVLILLGYVRHLRHLAREAARGFTGPVDEPPAVDPTVQAPEPVALNPHRHPFGEQEPMLRGRVTDTSGTPLRDAVITVTTPHGRQLLRTRTDERGEYAATGFDDGFVFVVASATGRQAAVERHRLGAGPAPVAQDFTLAPRPAAGVGQPSAAGYFG